MAKVVTFLALLSQLTPGHSINRVCVPNTRFILNGQLCHCNHFGRWTEANCVSIGRRASCLSGQLIRQGCSQCICQENGQLLCSNTGCYDEVTHKSASLPNIDKKDASNIWCTPFKSYYVNCNICVCPASGKTSDAHCAIDHSCKRPPISTSDFLVSVNKDICIPNVMYLFPCLHCLCSDSGHFVLEKCVETCHQQQQTEPTRRCLSRTFYRKNCNICWCPDNSIPDDKLCTKTHCTKNSKFQPLLTLKSAHTSCRPHSFVKPKCLYCGCNTKGYINENMCLELECLKFNEYKYDVTKTACSPGEMIPICIECFCLRNGMTNSSYCSNTCSIQSKLNLLEEVLKDSNTNKLLINKIDLVKSSDVDQCEPNSLYLDRGRYCLCPENGNTDFKLCTSVAIDDIITKRPIRASVASVAYVHKNLNQTCKPNTFVESDCNTCYCGKSGKIDPKWCTYDDCNAKKLVQETHRSNRISTPLTLNTTCMPGSISKTDCNFCICPENGMMTDRACTKNKCSEVQNTDDNKFLCDPLEYYLVDCNICLCPQDGVKNVAKCTKKICEKTFLRSDSCVSGQFFSSDCNVCVCPPNGIKADKVCTNHSCSDADSPWKKIFRLSQNSIVNSENQENKRQLEVCFSGEEFEVGCKICVCTDVGLKAYAICSNTRCEEQNKVNSSLKTLDPLLKVGDVNEGGEEGHRSRRDGETCMTLNLTDSSERKACTPGSMYIIRCRQCICPYVGNINHFCRPLPKGTYCEQAYPNFNYLPMGRRNEEKNLTSSFNATTANATSTPIIPMNHAHTEFNCARAGPVSDECFMCECGTTRRLVAEHCFRSDAAACRAQEPSFLDHRTKTVLDTAEPTVINSTISTTDGKH